MTAIDDLKPHLLWKYFSEILHIPRPSKKEEKIIAYIIDFAKEHKLEYKKDETGNILISKPPSKGFHNRKSTVLQSHMDMVCEKNADVKHNFETDAITAYIDKGWIRARGTTLGADNGIGIATQLAILADNSLKHGPIECLFTVDEETGLTGAYNIRPGVFKSRILINLDSEDEGELFIGCAGGMDTLIEMSYTSKPCKKVHSAYTVTICGLKGGHSGDDINKGRGNSNKILIRFLWDSSKHFKIRLFDFQGGNLRNSIPREAVAGIVIKQSNIPEFLKKFNDFKVEIQNEFRNTEPDLDLIVKETKMPQMVLSMKSQKKFLNVLHACPNGVIEMSPEIEGLVQTSTNLASVKFSGDTIINVVTSHRSSVKSSMLNISNQIAALFSLVKADITQTKGYPGWKPDTNSEIVNIARSAYQSLFQKEPVVRAIHAGLECGLFLEKYPDIDMVSFGPTIKEAHSPGEKMNISTVDKFWELLLKVLENIPEN